MTADPRVEAVAKAFRKVMNEPFTRRTLDEEEAMNFLAMLDAVRRCEAEQETISSRVVGRVDRHDEIKAIEARAREAERADVSAWLRECAEAKKRFADDYEKDGEKDYAIGARAIVGELLRQADLIETNHHAHILARRGDHLKARQP